MDIEENKLRSCRLLALVTFIGMGLLSGFGYSQIGDFERLLNEMGGSKPLVTNLYLSSYQYWSVLTVFPLFVLLQTRSTKNRLKIPLNLVTCVLLTHWLFGLLVFVGAVYALYAPIFALGDAQ